MSIEKNPKFQLLGSVETINPNAYKKPGNNDTQTINLQDTSKIQRELAGAPGHLPPRSLASLPIAPSSSNLAGQPAEDSFLSSKINHDGLKKVDVPLIEGFADTQEIVQNLTGTKWSLPVRNQSTDGIPAVKKDVEGAFDQTTATLDTVVPAEAQKAPIAPEKTESVAKAAELSKSKSPQELVDNEVKKVIEGFNSGAVKDGNYAAGQMVPFMNNLQRKYLGGYQLDGYLPAFSNKMNQMVDNSVRAHWDANPPKNSTEFKNVNSFKEELAKFTANHKASPEGHAVATSAIAKAKGISLDDVLFRETLNQSKKFGGDKKMFDRFARMLDTIRRNPEILEHFKRA